MKNEEFFGRNKTIIREMGADQELKSLSRNWFDTASKHEYSYHFTWMGLPIIQFPQDIVAMQEIIWEVKPDLIIETGVARGGSIIYYSSLLELIGNDGIVVGIDIDIRKHNRELIEQHPMFSRVKLIEGSSTSVETVEEVKAIAKKKSKVMVCLDSNHTHDHVLAELNLYAPLTSLGSYCVVFDTVVEEMPADYDWGSRWGRGNNPKTAVNEFLKEHAGFQIDENINNKLLISVAPDGYLKRVH